MTKKRINLDLDAELWKQLSIEAIDSGKQKREIVEKAIQDYLEKSGRIKTVLGLDGKFDILPNRDS